MSGSGRKKTEVLAIKKKSAAADEGTVQNDMRAHMSIVPVTCESRLSRNTTISGYWVTSLVLFQTLESFLTNQVLFKKKFIYLFIYWQRVRFYGQKMFIYTGFFVCSGLFIDRSFLLKRSDVTEHEGSFFTEGRREHRSLSLKTRDCLIRWFERSGTWSGGILVFISSVWKVKKLLLRKSMLF